MSGSHAGLSAVSDKEWQAQKKKKEKGLKLG